MGLTITPHPTTSGIERAMASPGTVTIKAKYIGIGTGLQSIQLDDAGCAITDTMKEPVAWLEIMSSERVSSNQHRMLVDLAGISTDDFLLSELVLADENKKAILIYGNAKKALLAVSHHLEHMTIIINVVLTAYPANSVEIVHKSIPLELTNAASLLTIHNSLAIVCLEILEARKKSAELKNKILEKDKIIEKESRRIDFLVEQNNRNQQALVSQNTFNAYVFDGIGKLVLSKLDERTM